MKEVKNGDLIEKISLLRSSLPFIEEEEREHNQISCVKETWLCKVNGEDRTLVFLVKTEGIRSALTGKLSNHSNIRDSFMKIGGKEIY